MLHSSNNPFVVTELSRKLHNLLRIGVIAAIDSDKAAAKVTLGNITTTWLPILTTRAGLDKTFWLPDISEQVLVLSPGGELTQGIILPALYQNKFSAPSNNPDIATIHFDDGTTITYDKAQHQLSIDCCGDIQLRTTGNITLMGDVTIQGNVHATGNMFSDGQNSNHHRH